MAIRGSLREASLPDVLQLLAMGKKTGCLSVTHRQSFGNVYFNRGRICYASIINRRDRLGDILLRDGLIARSDLDLALAQQAREPERRLGEILMAAGAIQREQLHSYITRQIEEAVYHLFTWQQGTFNFEPDVGPDSQDVLVSISPESLLLEGARRVDEWSLIEKKISSFDLIFALDRSHLTSSDVVLTQEQEILLPFIDGRRDVSGLVEESGLDDFDVGKALFGLASAGFLHGVGRSNGAGQVANEARVSEHRNLGLAFYKTAMFDEALREFRRVLELRPGDALAEFHVGLVAIRQGRLDDGIRAFRLCASRPGATASAHVNLSYALERAGRFEEARASLVDAERLRPEDPVIRLAHAVLALRRGEIEIADSRLQECATLLGSHSRPPTWFHYAGLVAALRGDVDRSIAILDEGSRTHPHAAVLHNNLAVALERRGRYEEAASAAERCSLEDPTLPQVHKNLGDLAYRAARYDEALEAYQRAVRYDPQLGGDVYLKMGNIRYRRGEREDAIRCWEQSISLAPDNPMAKNNLATARRLA
jgi:tetratricopeptide (TPR) repeat protein